MKIVRGLIVMALILVGVGMDTQAQEVTGELGIRVAPAITVGGQEGLYTYLQPLTFFDVVGIQGGLFAAKGFKPEFGAGIGVDIRKIIECAGGKVKWNLPDWIDPSIGASYLFTRKDVAIYGDLVKIKF